MLPARNTIAVFTSRRPIPVRPLPPQPLPNLGAGASDDATPAVETPTVPPRKTQSGVATVVGFAPIVVVKAAPPPLPARNVIATSSSERTGIVTTDMFLFPEEDGAEVLARELPMTPFARVFPIIMTVGLFIAYAHVAALRWTMRTLPRLGTRARMLLVESRLRVHVEWARAAARARTAAAPRAAARRPG